ncbi:hypothetical protein Tco_1109004 [Tanacetum coccineum]
MMVCLMTIKKKPQYLKMINLRKNRCQFMIPILKMFIEEEEDCWEKRICEKEVNMEDFEQRIMARMDEQLDQFFDQLTDRMNDMMNPKRRGDRNGRRNECEESENSFFKGEGSSSFVELEEWEGNGVADDDYEEAPVFDDDQFEENRWLFMIPILKMSLRRKNDLLGKEDLVRKKTTWKTL